MTARENSVVPLVSTRVSVEIEEHKGITITRVPRESRAGQHALVPDSAGAQMKFQLPQLTFQSAHHKMPTSH